MKNLKTKNNFNRKVKLSQCMIVKNEEKNIEQALTWAKEIAFEQIVVDTGSTDRTVEIAEQMGAKVFHYEWNDDFASAKNFALEQASGNWVAFLDADEYLLPEDAHKMLEIIQQIHTTKNFPNIQVHVLRTSLANIEDDGSIISITNHDRIFINTPTLRYKNRIHERLELNGTTNYSIIIATDLTIFHTGYATKTLESTSKIDRNIRILEKEISDNPNNPDTPEILSYLGESYFYNNEIKKAEQLCWQAINFCEVNPNGFNGLYNERLIVTLKTLINSMVIRHSSFDDILNVYNLAKSRISNYPDFDFQFAQWMFDDKNWQEAAEYYLKALDIFENNKSADSDIVSNFYLIYRNLAVCFQKLNNFSNTVKYATLSLNVNKYQYELLASLISIFNSNGFSSGEEEIFTFLSKIYNFSSTKDKLFTMKCSKAANNNKLYELLFSTLTPSEQKWLES